MTYVVNVFRLTRGHKHMLMHAENTREPYVRKKDILDLDHIATFFIIMFSNFKAFLIIWLVVLVGNQIVIFGACFAPYCLVAALPHTSIIAAVLTFVTHKSRHT